MPISNLGFADRPGRPRRPSLRNVTLQGLILMAVWLILSGHYDWLHILYGVLSVAFVLWLNLRLRGVPLAGTEPSGHTHIRLPRLAVYLVWLLWQIVKSGLFVAYLVLHPRMPIQPAVIRFRSWQPNVLARVILGNSITLTPGTLTMDIRGDTFTVHALTRAMADDLVSGEMEAWVISLYSRTCPPGEACCDIERFNRREDLEHG